MENPFESLENRLSNIEKMLEELKTTLMPYTTIPKTYIEKNKLSVRAYNGLRNAGINTIEELVEYDERTLLRYKDIGKKSVSEIREYLSKLGITFKW